MQSASSSAMRAASVYVLLVALTSLIGSSSPPTALLAADTNEAVIPIATIKRDEPVDFASEILPALRRSCLACHSASKPRAGINLETPASIRAGADGDEVIDLASPAESPLLLVASHAEDPVMPPTKNKVGATPLSSDELGLLMLWIAQGAPDSGKDDKSGSDPNKPNWQVFPDVLAPIYAVDIDGDGRFVAAGRANQIWLHDLVTSASTRLTDPAILESGLYTKPGVAHLDGVQSLAFHPDDDILVSGGFRTVKFWRRSDAAIDTSAAVEPGQSNDDPLSAISGGVTFRGSPDGVLNVHRNTDSGPGEVLGHTKLASPIATLLALDKGKRLAVACEDGSLRVYLVVPENSPGQGPRWRFYLQQNLPSHEKPIHLLLDVGDGQLLSASTDGKIRFLAADGSVSRELAMKNAVKKLSLTPDMKSLAVVLDDGSLALASVESGEISKRFTANGPTEKALAHLERVHGVLDARFKESTSAAEEARKKIQPAEEALKKISEELTAAAKDASTKLTAVTDLKQKQETSDSGLRKLTSEIQRLKDSVAAIDTELKELESAVGGESVQLARTALKSQRALTDKRLAAQTERQTKSAAEKAEIDKKLAEAEKAHAAAEGTHVQKGRQHKDTARDRELAVKRVETLDVKRKKDEARAQTAKAKLDEDKKHSRADIEISALKFSSDGQRMASAQYNGTVSVWRVEDAALLARFKNESDSKILEVDFEGEKNDKISVRTARTTALWRLELRWELAQTLGDVDDPATFGDRITALRFSHDGAILAIGGGEPSRSGDLQLWSRDGKLLWRVDKAHSDTVLGLDFSVDGDYLASCGSDRVVRIFRVNNGESIASFEGHTDHVLGVAWRADGKRLASCGADKVVKIWDFIERKQSRTIAGFGKHVTAVRFVANSAHAVVCGGDSAVRMYNCDNGGTVRNFEGAKDYLYSLAVTPNGHLISVGGFDSVVRVWNAEDGKLVQELKP